MTERESEGEEEKTHRERGKKLKIRIYIPINCHHYSTGRKQQEKKPTKILKSDNILIPQQKQNEQKTKEIETKTKQ